MRGWGRCGSMATPDSHSRGASLLNWEGLQNCRVAVAGCGAVGRQLCLQLAAAGQRQLVVFDHDMVEEVNLGPQGWSPGAVGTEKVNALQADLCHHYAGSDQLPVGWQFEARRFPMRPELALESLDAIFLCVDQIQVRRAIYEAWKPELCDTGALFDVRVAGEIMRLVTCCDKRAWDYYAETLFEPERAMQVSCTSKMTIHLASLAAALQVQQYSMWLRGSGALIEKDVVCNWLAMETHTKR